MTVLVVMLTLGTIGVAIWALVAGLRVSNGLIPAFWSVIAQARDVVRHIGSFCALHCAGMLLGSAMHHNPLLMAASSHLEILLCRFRTQWMWPTTSSPAATTFVHCLMRQPMLFQVSAGNITPAPACTCVDSQAHGPPAPQPVQRRGLPRCTVHQHPPEVDSMRLMRHQPCSLDFRRGLPS